MNDWSRMFVWPHRDLASAAATGTMPDVRSGGVDLSAMRDRVAAGDTDGAVAALHLQVARHPESSLAWYLLGMKMLENGQHRDAYRAIGQSLDVDPSHPDAFEQYIEMVNRWEPTAAKLTQATDRYARDLTDKPHRHRDALDFVVALNISTAHPALLAGPDRVAAAGVRVAQLLRQRVGSAQAAATVRGEYPDLTPTDVDTLLLRVLLARGRYSEAMPRLAATPAGLIPVRATRRTARRALRHGNHRHARTLLQQLQRVLPEDAWVRGKLRILDAVEQETTRGKERSRLLEQGYRFPEGAPRPIDVDASTALYLLHNSLPYTSAGYATRTHGLLRALRTMGWDVHGVTRPGFPFDRAGDTLPDSVPTADVVDGVIYHRMSSRRERLPRSPLEPYVDLYADRLAALMHVQRPFVVHAASNHWNGLAAVTAARRAGLPSVYEVRGLWEITRISREPHWQDSQDHRFMARMEADAAKAADHVLVITEALGREMIDRGVDPAAITVVPNGVDVDRFVPAPRDEELGASLGIPAGVPVIGYVGSVLDYEGIDLLLEAVALLEGSTRDFRVLIVGDGAYLDQARRLAHSRRLDQRVRFTGRVPHEQVERYYSLIDIAPLPRHALPVCEMVSPLKPFEAMAMGKLVVASDVAALSEIVLDGVNGRLHAKGDAHSLAEVLRELLDDVGQARRLGAQSRDWVAEHRDWGTVAREIDRVYRSLGGVPATVHGRPADADRAAGRQ